MVMTLGLAVQQAEQDPAVIQPAVSTASKVFELGYGIEESPFIQWLLYQIYSVQFGASDKRKIQINWIKISRRHYEGTEGFAL